MYIRVLPCLMLYDVLLYMHLPCTSTWYHVPVAAPWEDYVRIIQGVYRASVSVMRVMKGLYRDHIEITSG